MKQVIHDTSDIKITCALYTRALEVDQQNTLVGYMMATSELDTVLKAGHNNPAEAAEFKKELDRLTEKFMEEIAGFDHYKQESAYQQYVHDVYTLLTKPDPEYFKNASVTTVLDLLQDK